MSEAPPDPLDRLLGPFTRLVKLTFPALRFAGVYEYALVSGAAGPTLTGRCTDPGVGMPDIQDVTMLPSTCGASATWAIPGTKFYVTFANLDPTRPIVVAGDAAQTPDAVAIPANVSVAIAGGADALVKATPYADLLLVLTTFLTGLNMSTLSGQATTAAGAMSSLPPAATVKVKAT